MRAFQVISVGSAQSAKIIPPMLDHQKTQCLAEELSFLVGTGGWRDLRLDFSNVQSLTAATIGKLVSLSRDLDRLTLCHVSPLLFEAFQVAGLSQVLDILPPSILVVDDSAPTREALDAFLTANGFQVACAGNGREALDYLRTSDLPSVVVLDLNMPVMDGWHFREAQKRDPALAGIGVIVASAESNLPEVASALGVSTCLSKPIELNVLLNAIRTLESDHAAGPLR